MHPTLRQVPPKVPPSMTATRLSSKSGVTSELPEPLPMMARSKCWVTVAAYGPPRSHRLGTPNDLPPGPPQRASGRPDPHAGSEAARAAEETDVRRGGRVEAEAEREIGRREVGEGDVVREP